MQLYTGILMVLSFLVVILIREDPVLTEVKRRYRVLRESELPEKFQVLRRRILVSGYKNSWFGIGYNVNKGYEIGLCLNGSPNDVFHVLLHELCHSTIREYDHSTQFWQNLRELKAHASSLGIYEPVSSEKSFCGGTIKD